MEVHWLKQISLMMGMFDMHQDRDGVHDFV